MKDLFCVFALFACVCVTASMRLCQRADTCLSQVSGVVDSCMKNDVVSFVDSFLNRLFDKCTKTRDFDFRGVQQALMFAQSVEAYSEDDLPWRLTKVFSRSA